MDFQNNNVVVVIIHHHLNKLNDNTTDAAHRYFQGPITSFIQVKKTLLKSKSRSH